MRATWVFDGFTLRKWTIILTDEVPTRPNFFLGNDHYKACRTGDMTRWLTQIISE